MANDIYLCGTVHSDIFGPERLERVLSQFKPDTICVEAYPELAKKIITDLEKRRNLTREDLRQLIQKSDFPNKEKINLETANALIKSIGYEIAIPLEYAQRTEADIQYLEDETQLRGAIFELMADLLKHPEKIIPFLDLVRYSPEQLKKMTDNFYYDFIDSNNSTKKQDIQRNEFLLVR